MSGNNDKLFDLSSIGIEPQEKAGDLLSDKDLDEMQRAVTYKLTFGIFQVSFWLFLIISLAMLIAAEWTDTQNLPLSVFALIVEVIDMGLYIFYAAKTSAKGLMREKYAKAMGRKSIIFCYLFVGIIYMTAYGSLSIFFRLYAGIVYLSICAVSLFAMRNNKVIEKINKEE